jgi:hypothetical protein
MKDFTKTGILSLLVLCSVAACTKEEAQSATADASTTAAPASASSATVHSVSSVPSVTVYKDPNCGCCSKWVDYMKANGFNVTAIDTSDVASIKAKHGIGSELQSCHTAIVGDYAIEGHVPAEEIHRMLKEKPTIAGLAVPGMPTGSPGMEGAIKEKYDILTFDRAGRTTVYAQR